MGKYGLKEKSGDIISITFATNIKEAIDFFTIRKKLINSDTLLNLFEVVYLN